MRKAILVISVAIFGLIVLSLVLFGLYYAYLKTNYYVGNGSLLSEKVANIAIQKQDPSQCNKIRLVLGGTLDPMGPPEEELVQGCYIAVAHGLNDERICEYVSDRNKGSCLQPISLAKGEIKLCDGITTQLVDKGSCYSKFTEQGTNSSVCENIDESNQGTSLSGKDLCYIGAAKYSNDISICTTKIQTDHYRNSCYKIVAEGLNDVAICDKIQGQYSEADRNDCKRYINVNQ